MPANLLNKTQTPSPRSLNTPAHAKPGALADTINVSVGASDCTNVKGKTLATIGLGSCVGLAIVHPRTGSVALAHVFLPENNSGKPIERAKLGAYANTAVPHLLECLKVRSGASNGFYAAIVGGASMFRNRTQANEVGERNIAAVKAALKKANIPIVAEDVGGTKGRSIWVSVDTCTIEARSIGGKRELLWAPN